MIARVLVVCTANVCRSPTTAMLLHRRLDRAGLGPMVRLRTAGTAVLPGSPYCSVVADVVGPAAAGLRERHASRPLAAPVLQQSDLVLVMEREHRAVVVAADPSATARTFTLREAAALSRAVAAAGGPADGEVPDVVGFVRAMHAARGSVLPEPHARSVAERLRRADVVDPLDVPDAHVRRATGHEQVLALLEQGVDELLDGLLGPAGRATR